MTTTIPPNGPNDSSFDPWGKNYKPELIPVEIQTLGGNFSFNLPSYYAGAFELFDIGNFEELKHEIQDALTSDREEIFFGETILCNSDIDIKCNDSYSNYLLFFVLENFSNPNLELREEDRERIKRECVEIFFINEFEGPARDKSKADAYFLLFCKLVSIQEKVDNILEKNPLAKEHKEFVDRVVSSYIGSMEIVSDQSEISVLPRAHFESLITDKIPTGLRNRLWKLVQPKEWNRRIRDFQRNYSQSRIEAMESANVTMDAKLIQQTFEKLTRLENAIEPNTQNKRDAWEDPFNTIISSLDGKETVVYASDEPFKGRINDVEQASCPKLLKLQIRFLEEAAKKEFKNWLLTGSFICTLTTIVENLRDTIDELSLFELKAKVTDFLSPIKNKHDEDLRDFLGLDKSKKRSYSFKHAVNFVNDIRKIAKQYNFESKVFQCESGENDILEDWLNIDEKRLLFGGGVGIPFEDSVFIWHTNSRENDLEDFRITSGIACKVNDLATTKGYGWGKDKTSSVCIPIEENTELVKMKADEDIPIYESPSISVDFHGHRNLDFMIVTKENGNDDGDNDIEVFDPGPKIRTEGPLILT